MRSDKLASDFDRVVAINCNVSGDHISVGILFVDIQTPSLVTLKSEQGKEFAVELPEMFTMKPQPMLVTETKVDLQGEN